VTIPGDMASTRVEWFLAAKKTFRAHRGWTNEQVAEHNGIPRAEAGEVGIVATARQEVETDGIDPASRHTTRMTGQ
jgi:hypothetical protein